MPELPELARELEKLVRPRTMPVGIRFFESAEDLDAIKRLRKFGHQATVCQLVTQSRTAGWTIGAAAGDLMVGCSSVFGLAPPPDDVMDGSRMARVWFSTQEESKRHAQSVLRVPYGRYKAIAAAPLVADKLEPDVVAIYGTPAQIMLLINGLQWEGYRRYDFRIVGETACSDSVVQSFLSGEPAVAIPCFGERRYGGVADDEMVVALPPALLSKAVAGLKALAANGLRYPIPPYGSQCDPSAGMARSYGQQ